MGDQRARDGDALALTARQFVRPQLGLVAEADGYGAQVEGEIDSNRRGQTWRWRLYHNGSLSAHGLRTTSGPSDSFEIRRTSVDLRGTDRFTLRARNTRNNELCVGTVNY